MSVWSDLFLASLGMILGVSVAHEDWFPAALVLAFIAQEVGRNWLDRSAPKAKEGSDG